MPPTNHLTQDEATRLRARISTLEFLFGLSLIQQGPNTIRAFLKNTEEAYIKSTSIKDKDEEVFIKEAQLTLEGIRGDLIEGLEQWGAHWPTLNKGTPHA